MLCKVAADGKGMKADKPKRCSVAKAKETISHSSITWSQDPNNKSTMFSGGSDGKIYQWTGTSCKKPLANNKGAVHSVATAMEKDQELVLAGGHDKTVTIYTFAKGNLEKVATLPHGDDHL